MPRSHDREIEEALGEASRTYGEEIEKTDDLRSFLIDKYGEEKGGRMYAYEVGPAGTVSASWKCRDCIVLSQEEYFKKCDQFWKIDNEQLS